MTRMRQLIFAAVTTGTFVALAACSSSSSTSTTTAAPAETATGTSEGENATGAVAATEKDFAISLDQSSTAAGETTFSVMNEGPSVHEFVVFKTNLAPDALPVDKDGNVDEEGKGVEHISEIEDIGAGETKDLTVRLDGGAKYVVICNLPGHYKLGMYAGLDVA